MLKKLINKFKREPDFYVGGKEDPYLLRWWIIPRNRFFNVYLHKFLRDDEDRALHDHPWPSLTLFLKGRYIEYLEGGEKRFRKQGNVIYRGPRHAHRIALYRHRDGSLETAWTLFMTGPKMREWGFHCPQGWRHWKDFVDEADHGNVGRGCD